MAHQNATHSGPLQTEAAVENCNASWAQGPHTFQQVVYIPVFLLGLLLNASAVAAFLWKRKSWTDTHIYMLNLALADFFLVLFLPVRVFDAFLPLEPSNFCTVMISIHYINMYASIFTVTCISMHRYLSIRFPFWAHEKKRKGVALLVCSLIWVTVITICFLFHSNNAPDKLCTCYSRRDVNLSLSFFLVLEILGYLLPLLTMTFFSIRTSCILQKQEGDGDDCAKEDICSTQNSKFNRVYFLNKEMIVQKKTFVRLVTANLIVFFFCYTPVHVAIAVVEYYKFKDNLFSQDHLIHNFREVAEWIATTNCCLDAFGYYFLLRQYIQKRSAENTLEHLSSQNQNEMRLLE